MSQSTPASSYTISAQILVVQPQQSHNVVPNLVNVASTSNAPDFHKKPIYMEKYRQMSFLGILGSPHPISFDLRDKVVNFFGNNVVTSEENLKIFIDMLNEFEVEHEDVVMNSFIHSLTEDARDWFRRLLDDIISSWSDLEKKFKEQYGDNTNASFMLNNFNNIKKNLNEFTFDFNVRFQKGMYKLF